MWGDVKIVVFVFAHQNVQQVQHDTFIMDQFAQIPLGLVDSGPRFAAKINYKISFLFLESKTNLPVNRDRREDAECWDSAETRTPA